MDEPKPDPWCKYAPDSCNLHPFGKRKCERCGGSCAMEARCAACAEIATLRARLAIAESAAAVRAAGRSVKS